MYHLIFGVQSNDNLCIYANNLGKIVPKLHRGYIFVQRKNILFDISYCIVKLADGSDKPTKTIFFSEIFSHKDVFMKNYES